MPTVVISDTKIAMPANTVALGTISAEDVKTDVWTMPDGTLNIDRYEIDFRICMYCGLCTEACPYQAIQAGGRYDDAVYVFENMYRNRESLTREAKTYMAKTDGRYPNGQTQELSPTRTEMPTAKSRIPGAGVDGPFGPQHLHSRAEHHQH